MKHTVKTLIAVTLVFMMAASYNFAFASNQDANAVELTSGKIINNNALQGAIDDFFTLRSYNAQAELNSNSVQDATRMSAFTTYSEDTGLTVVQAVSTPYIEKATYLSNGDIVLSVYEWVAVDYIPNGSTTTDSMGYEVQHEMTLRNFNNAYTCVNDSNDELALLLYGDCDPAMATTETIDDINAVPSQANITFDDYDVDAVITYADNWVDHKIHTETASGPHKYNPDYGYFSDNDCANYVSQCIFAGGMPSDYGSGSDYTSADQWWFDSSKVVSGRSNSMTTCPSPWRSISSLTPYFKGLGYKIEEVQSGGSNLYPGNLEFANGHIVMCVGYNSGGQPVCNGHTRDVWHYVYNNATVSTGRKTILFVDSDLT